MKIEIKQAFDVSWYWYSHDNCHDMTEKYREQLDKIAFDHTKDALIDGNRSGTLYARVDGWRFDGDWSAREIEA